jgi:ubiquinone biosynthesis monooxygenase Coq7
MISLDRLIGEFDRALRAVAGVAQASRPSPAEGLPETTIGDEERAHAAALMAKFARRRFIRGRR